HNDLGITLARRVGHCVLLEPIDGADIRTLCQQMTSYVKMTAMCSGHERRHAVGGSEIDVSSRVDHLYRDGRSIILHVDHQNGLARAVARIDVGAVRKRVSNARLVTGASRREELGVQREVLSQC